MFLYYLQICAALIILFYVIYFVHFFWIINRMEQKIQSIPCPKGYPIIRNLLLFRNVGELLYIIMDLAKQYDGLFRITAGPGLLSVVVSDPDTLQYILSSNKLIEKAYVYQFMYRWLNNGLLTSSGEKWHKKRRLLTPAFHFTILERAVVIFNKKGRVFIDRLQTQSAIGEAFDVFPHVALLTLDVICESAMGINIDAQKNSESKYVKSIKGISTIIVKRALSPFMLHEVLYRFSITYLKEILLLRRLHGTTESVIKSRRETLSKENAKNESADEEKENDAAENEFSTKKRSQFLDILLESKIDGVPLKDEEIREEVDTFMFEGHDTTSSAISFTLYCLSKHEEIQRKVMEELDGIFHGDRKRDITYNDLQEMKYLEMVIKESIRLFPPVPIIGRIATEDFVVKGKFFPAALDIQMIIIALHRDPKIYPDPLRFDPERFTMENQRRRNPYAYIPFSAGPRNCIGQRFAMLEVKSMVANVLRNFVLEPCENFEPHLVVELVLKSSNGVRLKLKKRE